MSVSDLIKDYRDKCFFTWSIGFKYLVVILCLFDKIKYFIGIEDITSKW